MLNVILLINKYTILNRKKELGNGFEQKKS